MTKEILHERRSIRLKGYDYTTPGAYFVTLSLDRGCEPLGEISDDEVVLNPSGNIVQSCLLEIPRHFKDVAIGEWVIMPDHLHVVIILCDPDISPRATDLITGQISILPHGTQPGSLNAVLQNFKSVSTRKVNQYTGIRGARLWQRNYYEHIIRNEKELAEVSLYIQENPRRWNRDT